MLRQATALAHPNIALAKYWGKVPGSDNAPAVPSLSVTLAGMATTTTVIFDEGLAHDLFELNGASADEPSRQRVVALLDEVRSEANLSLRARVHSRNDFPTAAGLASSASGFAALAVAARAAAGLPSDPAWESHLARRVSASSARSLFGGYVELPAGEEGQQRFLPAKPVAPPGALPLRVLVAVTTERTKETLSTRGMNHTAQTSPYYRAWVEHAHRLFARIRAAVLAGDLEALGVAAEESALAMHASAIAAAPGVIYWLGVTVEILATVREMRSSGLGAWFTIDAGPHVKVLCAPADEARVKKVLEAIPGVLRVLIASPGEGARRVDGALL
ncbi:MAG: diphosphomevalonate decarboxylase [Myxococcales bacterium]|nr:diphosphomevalonate decarboxylase [Polyangiaceae bacterium]MDW8249198.1 diphosphomevalonate decarboxylase [Myxococcales bacterium]